jgi:hypothetical protein
MRHDPFFHRVSNSSSVFIAVWIISGLGRELSTGLFPIKNVIQVGPEAGGASIQQVTSSSQLC